MIVSLKPLLRSGFDFIIHPEPSGASQTIHTQPVHYFLNSHSSVQPVVLKGAFLWLNDCFMNITFFCSASWSRVIFMCLQFAELFGLTFTASLVFMAPHTSATALCPYGDFAGNQCAAVATNSLHNSAKNGPEAETCPTDGISMAADSQKTEDRQKPGKKPQCPLH